MAQLVVVAISERTRDLLERVLELYLEGNPAECVRDDLNAFRHALALTPACAELPSEDEMLAAAEYAFRLRQVPHGYDCRPGGQET